MSFRVTIIANKSNVFGISKDVDALRGIFESRSATVRVCDPLEPPSYTDVAVHLEAPSYVWMPWAGQNILIVNPKWFVVDAWRPYLARFDSIIVKDSITQRIFEEEFGLEKKVICIPWALAEAEATAATAVKPLNEFLWITGASKSKRAFVPVLLAAWKESYPRLLITSTTDMDLSGVTIPSNVEIRVGDLSPAARTELAAMHKGHVCCSMAEGFGYTAAEAEAVGAFTILNSLPVYASDYPAYSSGVSYLPSTLKRNGVATYDTGTADLEPSLNRAMERFAEYDDEDRALRRTRSKKRWEEFSETWSRLVEIIKGYVRTPIEFPPVVLPEDCPRISVVTLVYNRKKFFDLACHNMMITDYPKNKIEWIVVDDSDDPAEQNSDRIMAVMNASAPVEAIYVPLTKKRAVSEKRNLGVNRATSDIVLFMDDDDHYPETSFRRRVAWLTKHAWKPQAVGCTTIACYDLVKGISAVNQPPTDIPLGQRVSEATMAFYKSWWVERKFPAGVVVGEAEDFISGREADLLEIPPQQIIVAFSHGRNVSSRRVPSDTGVTPGCFWGFPREFLIFVHGLAGVKVLSD